MFGLRTIKWSKRQFSIQYQRNTLTQELEQMFGSSPRTGVEDARHVEDICVGKIRWIIEDVVEGRLRFQLRDDFLYSIKEIHWTQELEQMFGSSPRTGVEDERHVEDICVGTIR
ncbi:hypothetical protein J6590_080906 [Homalodisca vitripennis]|nr:hypothetical protein J6590_080906 [Homalodisca vitripennis]